MPLDTSIALGVQPPQFMDPSRAMDFVAQAQQRQAESQINALRAQMLQQEMGRNEIAARYQAEDRARAYGDRQKAAAAAEAEKAFRARILQESGGDPVKASDLAIRYGRPDLAEYYAKGRESIAKAGAEESDAQKKAFFNAYMEMSAYAPLVANGAIPGRAVVGAMFNHPILGKVLSKAMTPDEALAYADKDPQGLAQILATSPDKIYDSVVTAQQPKPETLAAGATAVDMNPRSPTYGQQIARGAPSEQELKVKKQDEGRKAIDETLSTMAEEYGKLAKEGNMPSENKSWAENLGPRAAASAAGRLAGLNPKAQSSYQRLEGLRRDLITAIKNATGMSAQEMNSNVELQQMIAATTEPGQNIEAVRRRMSDISKRYGLGMKFEAEESAKPAQTKSAPNTNAKGWTLHTDANGNQAYVSPDGKQFEEVK